MDNQAMNRSEALSTPEERMINLGIELGPVRPLVGNYVTCVRTGNLLFTAGQGVDEYHAN